jgi:hypothetical protein
VGIFVSPHPVKVFMLVHVLPVSVVLQSLLLALTVPAKAIPKFKCSTELTSSFGGEATPLNEIPLLVDLKIPGEPFSPSTIIPPPKFANPVTAELAPPYDCTVQLTP